MDYFPIPVISVKGYCDIEIGVDSISVTAKLRRSKALTYDHNKLCAYSFEVYGDENYFPDLYHEGRAIQQLLDNLQASDKHEIAFSFRFGFDTDGDKIFAIVSCFEEKTSIALRMAAHLWCLWAGRHYCRLENKNSASAVTGPAITGLLRRILHTPNDNGFLAGHSYNLQSNARNSGHSKSFCSSYT